MKKFWIIIGVMFLDLIVISLIFHRPLRITFHRLARSAALDGMHRSTSSQEDYRKYTEDMTYHEDALIRLGYLEKRTFDLKYLKIPSPEAEKVFEEYRKMYPKDSYSVSVGKKPSILDRPGKMPVWEELFRKYDVPPPDSNNVAALEDGAPSLN